MAKIEINGSQAVSELDKLTRKYDDLTKAQKRFTEGSEDYNALQKEINETASDIDKYRKKLDITGLSYKQLQRLQKDLRKDMRGLGQDTQEYADKQKELAKVNLQMKNIQKSARAVAKETGELNKKTSNFASTFLGTLAGNQVSSALDKVVGSMGNVVSETFEASEELRILKNELESIDVKNIDQVAESFLAFDKVFKVGTENITDGFNGFNKAYDDLGETKSLELIEKGLVQAGKKGKEFLERLKEYSIQFKKLGVDGEEAIKLVLQSLQGGGFNDKFEDTLKEFRLAIREFDKAQEDALKNAFGQKFAKEVSQGVNTGLLSAEDALNKIIAKTRESNLNQQQMAKLTADVFKSAGEDLGDFEEVMEQFTLAQNQNLEATTELQKAQRERLALEKQLASSQNKLSEEFAGTNQAIGNTFLQVKILITEGLVNLIQFIKAIPGPLKILLPIILAINVAKKAWAVASGLVIKSFKGLKAVIASNPFGAIATVITVAVTALSSFKSKTDEVAKAGEEATKPLRKLNTEFNLQIERLKKLKSESEERKRLIEEINGKYNQYLPNLLDEKSSIEDITKAQKDANAVFQQKIQLMSIEAQQKQIIDEIATLRNKQAKAVRDLQKANESYGLNATTMGNLVSGSFQRNTGVIINNQKEVKELEKLYSSLEKQAKDIQAPDLNPESSDKGKNTNTGAGDEEAFRKQQESYRKHLEELRKKEEAYRRAKLEAERRIQDLRISLIDDEFAQKRAKVELDHQRELEAIQVQGEQRAELEYLLLQEKNNKLAEINQAEKERKKQEAEAFDAELEQSFAEAEAKEEERLREKYELEKENEELRFLENQLLMEERFEATLEAEMSREQRLFELKQQFLESRLALAVEMHGKESIEAKRIRNELLQNQIDFDKKELENKKRTEELKMKVQEAGYQGAKDIIGLGIELLSTDEGARKRHAGAIKAFQAADIFVGLQREIQGIWENANKNPINALIPGWGTAFATVQTALATARAGSALGKVSSKQFKKGGILPQGPTHEQGGIKLVDGRTGQFTGYEIEGREAVLSRETTERNRPLVQDLLRDGRPSEQTLLQYANKTVRYRTGTEEIGTSPARQSNASNIEAVNTEIDNQAIESNMMLSNAVYSLIEEIQAEKQMFRKAYISYPDLEETNEEVQKARNENRR